VLKGRQRRSFKFVIKKQISHHGDNLYYDCLVLPAQRMISSCRHTSSSLEKDACEDCHVHDRRLRRGRVTPLRDCWLKVSPSSCLLPEETFATLRRVPRRSSFSASTPDPENMRAKLVCAAPPAESQKEDTNNFQSF
jgi:hypothetical protein